MDSSASPSMLPVPALVLAYFADVVDVVDDVAGEEVDENEKVFVLLFWFLLHAYTVFRIGNVLLLVAARVLVLALSDDLATFRNIIEKR
jgi:cytochrome c biogenesis protein CcdA